MRRVERRHTFLRRRIPSVDDVVIQPKQAAAAGRPHTFCIRGDINRLGIRVVQIELHAMRHGMAQGRLTLIAVLWADAPSESVAATEKLYWVDADKPVTLYVGLVVVAIDVPF